MIRYLAITLLAVSMSLAFSIGNVKAGSFGNQFNNGGFHHHKGGFNNHFYNGFGHKNFGIQPVFYPKPIFITPKPVYFGHKHFHSQPFFFKNGKSFH